MQIINIIKRKIVFIALPISILSSIFLLFLGIANAKNSIASEIGETSIPVGAITKLTAFQDQARFYHKEGLKFQKSGDYNKALSFFQKAIEIDGLYELAYNDLGILHETFGFINEAEWCYLEAIRVNPEFLSPYSNLALLYENKNKLKEAAYYWEKRAQLGLPDDIWTKKAENRFYQLAQILPELKEKYLAYESNKLINNILEERRRKRMEELSRSNQYYLLAKNLYNNKEYRKALETLDKSLSLDSVNMEKIQMRNQVAAIIEKQEKEERIKKMEAHYKSGLREFQQDNPIIAKEEFGKLLEEVGASTPNKTNQ